MELTVRVDHFHHFESGRVDQTLDHFLTQLGALTMTLKDVQDKVTQLTADVAAETALDQSIITLIQGDAALIADLRSQLAAAIAANDPAALQAVVDSMAAAHATMVDNATKAAAAVVANTPA